MSSSTQGRKASMTMADLEAIHEERTTPTPPPPQDENVEIFHEICKDIEQHDDDVVVLQARRRRGSLCQDEDDIINDYCETTTTPFRRHSSYESRAREQSRQAHSDAKEYLLSAEDSPHAERRASFVNNMLEFNLSLSIADGINNDNKSRMQLSCPVLSYMNDDEEDSVELRMMKQQRPSMTTTTYVGDEESSSEDKISSWEGLADESSQQQQLQQQSREYVIELPPMDDEELQDTKPRRRRRKPHSYKLLEQQLEEHSPIEVLKHFNTSFNVQPESSRPAASLPPPTAQQPKSLEQDNDLRKAMSMSSPPMASSRPATARGA